MPARKARRKSTARGASTLKLLTHGHSAKSAAGSKCNRLCRHDTMPVEDNPLMTQQRAAGTSPSREGMQRWCRSKTTRPDLPFGRRVEHVPSLQCGMPTGLGGFLASAQNPQPQSCPDSPARKPVPGCWPRRGRRGGTGRPCSSTLPSVRGELHAIVQSPASAS